MTFYHLIILAVIFLIIGLLAGKRRPRYEYLYKRRKYMTTYSETNLYRKLLSIYSDRFIIVPQVHLSSLFSERVKGQNWRAAFAHINGKSVDFVFLDKNTLEIVFALELDDFTHNEEKRIIRDEEVNAIFDRARLPLVRLRNTLNKTAAQIRKEIELGLNNSI